MFVFKLTDIWAAESQWAKYSIVHWWWQEMFMYRLSTCKQPAKQNILNWLQYVSGTLLHYFVICWPQNILELELDGLHEDVMLKFLVNITTTTTFVAARH